MKRIILWMIAGMASAHPIAAQSPVAAKMENAADSADAARRGYRAALATFRAGDTTKALTEALNAAKAWPVQPAYWTAAARIAALAGDAAQSAFALEQMADRGLGANLENDAQFARVRDDARWRKAAARAADLTKPMAASTVSWTFADTAFFPEGLAVDPSSGTLFITSIRTGHVLRRAADGAAERLTSSEVASAIRSALGIAFDAKRQALWIATADLPHGASHDSTRVSRTALVAISARDGRLLGRWPAPDTARAQQFGDVAVGANGDVFVSDAVAGVVYRLAAGAVRDVPATLALTAVARGGLVRSPQGIVPHPDGSSLLVAEYSHGLLHISLRDGRVTRIADPTGLTLAGIDGLCVRGTDVYGVQNGVAPGRVLALSFSRDFRTITSQRVLDRRPDVAIEPTQCVVLNGQVHYVANSSWGAFGDDGRRTGRVPLVAPLVLTVVP